MPKPRTFVCDFETTVYDEQTYTEVWAAAIVELNTESVIILNSIDDWFEFFENLEESCIVYFHNLKFDGSFILDYLFRSKYKHGIYETNIDGKQVKKFYEKQEMPRKSYTYNISSKGIWYGITIRKQDKKYIDIRDSYKLLPFSVKRLGNSFGTKHHKLDMEYEGYRYAGCEITKEEKEYIANDVLVVKEALEIMFAEGHDKLTIGACCLSEYKHIVGKEDWKLLFPNVYEQELPLETGYNSVGAFCLASYRGAWCYVVEGKEKRVFKNGLTADVNSLYPSVMSSESGNYYPVGNAQEWIGNYIPRKARPKDRYYFIRVRTKFYLKDGYLPFIQIKNNWLYNPRKCLKTSDIEYDNYVLSEPVELVWTRTDYELILQHYDLEDFEILSGCWFYAQCGIFDEYIEKYKLQKETSKGARRESAKLFLNNLYGKMATSTNSSYKVGYMKEGDKLGFETVEEHEKKPGYIPVGSAITAYARAFTIRHAQKNYHGIDKPGFIYADTDSLSCDLPESELIDIKEHPTHFGCWKIENYWNEAWFVRAKTYAKHITHEDKEPVEPHWKITCAGMNDTAKELLIASIEGKDIETDNEEYKRFVSEKRTIEDFNDGLCVPGKLLPVRMKGGIVLQNTTFKLRNSQSM